MSKNSRFDPYRAARSQTSVFELQEASFYNFYIFLQSEKVHETAFKAVSSS